MTPWKHAVSSAKHHGGEPDEYIKYHEWFDGTKAYTGDWTHRAMRHHSVGIQECVNLFGHAFTNSVGRSVPIKTIAEQHVMEDCGRIPTVQDWLTPLKHHPEPWMLRVGTKTTKPLEVA